MGRVVEELEDMAMKNPSNLVWSNQVVSSGQGSGV